MPYKYRQLDSHASATPKTSKKPKTTDSAKEYALEQKRAAQKLYSTSNQPYKTQRNVNYNLEWAKAKAVVSQADTAKLARQAQSAANQNAYNKAQQTIAKGVKGTPPRTGPSAGGRSSLYSRLTGGGLMKHGR